MEDLHAAGGGVRVLAERQTLDLGAMTITGRRNRLAQTVI